MITSLLLTMLACQPAPAPTATAPVADAAGEGAQVVARWEGTQLTLAEVDAKASSALTQARQQIYDARRGALDDLVAEKLLDAEAAKRGVTREALLDAEVTQKLPAVDEAKVLELYEANKPRLNGAPLEAVRSRIEAFLMQEAGGERQRAFLDELRKGAGVKVLLDPPRVAVEVPADAARFGSAEAPVQIVEWSDFQCPYCTKAATTLAEVKARYGDKVSVVFRHFPLDFHPQARKAAEAAACAQDQGRFWEYHDVLFAHQDALAEDALQTYARDLGLDVGVFGDCLSSGKHAKRVQTDLEEGAKLGVQGTPGFFVNGRFLGGALPIEAFAALIDEELEKR